MREADKLTNPEGVTVTVDLADLYMALAWAEVGIFERKRQGAGGVDYVAAQRRVDACRDALDAAAREAGGGS